MINNKKTIYIHIGKHKTASTFLQKIMADNRDILKERGIYYPRYLYLEQGKNKTRPMVNGTVVQHYNEDEIKKTLKAFDSSDCNKLVFSEENLFIDNYSNLLSFVAKYKEQYDIKIICYIREIVSYVLSMWSFLSNEKWCTLQMSLRDFVHSARPQNLEKRVIKFPANTLNYMGGVDLLFKLTKTLGAKQVIVKAYDKKILHNSIEESFFAIIGCDVSNLKITNNINISPNLKQAEKLIYLNRNTSDIFLRRHISKDLLAKDLNSKCTLTIDELNLIYETFHHYELKLIKKFLGGAKSEDVFSFTYRDWLKKINYANESRFLIDSEKSEIKILIKKYSSTPKVSIIIPVYDVSKYLRKCLDSVINQILKEIEIIIINDCSPDPKDDEICTEYAKKDKRIVYVKHEKNLGPGGARNTGIKIAKAEYIGFIDSDDWIDYDMFSELFNSILETDSDIVGCGFVLTNNNSIIKKIVFRANTVYLNQKNYLEIEHKACNKIIRKNLFIENNIFFPEKIFHEDLATMPRIFYYANAITYISKCHYYYFQRDSSTVHAHSNKHVDDYFKVFQILKDFYQERNIFDTMHQSYLGKIYGNLKFFTEKMEERNNIDTKAKKILYLYILKNLEEKVHLAQYFKQFNSQQLSLLFRMEITKPHQSAMSNSYSNLLFSQARIKRKLWELGKEITKRIGLCPIFLPFAEVFRECYFLLKNTRWGKKRKIWIIGKIITKRLGLYNFLLPSARLLKNYYRQRQR